MVLPFLSSLMYTLSLYSINKTNNTRPLYRIVTVHSISFNQSHDNAKLGDYFLLKAEVSFPVTGNLHTTCNPGLQWRIKGDFLVENFVHFVRNFEKNVQTTVWDLLFSKYFDPHLTCILQKISNSIRCKKGTVNKANKRTVRGDN